MNDSTILMGKNTLMKRCFRLYIERTGDESWSSLLPEMVGNVGIVFTNGDLIETRDKIGEFKKGAPARVGLMAPLDVHISAGPTGLGPEQTSFFQVRRPPPTNTHTHTHTHEKRLLPFPLSFQPELGLLLSGYLALSTSLPPSPPPPPPRALLFELPSTILIE